MKKMLLLCLLGTLFFIFFASCSSSSTTAPAIFTLKEPANCYMEALAHGKLVRDGDYLKLTSFGLELYLVWPYGYSVEMDGSTVLVLDESGIVVARTGETIKLGGGESPQYWVEELIGWDIPEDCAGTYWLTSGVIRD